MSAPRSTFVQQASRLHISLVVLALGGTLVALIGGVVRGPLALATGAVSLLTVAIGASKIRSWERSLHSRERLLVKRLRIVRKQRDRARKAEQQLREVVRTLLSEHHLEDRIERLQRSGDTAPARPRPRILSLVRDAANARQETVRSATQETDAVGEASESRPGSRIPVDDMLARLVLRGSLAKPDTIS